MQRKLNKNKLNKNLFIFLMLVFPLAQFAVFYVYLNFNNITLAFKGMRSDFSTYFVGFENFKMVFNGLETHYLVISLKNNLLMFLLTWIIGMPLNILFGYYLYKKRLGHRFIRIIYMLPSMVSGVVMAMLFMKFVELGLPLMWKEVFKTELPNLLRSNDTAFGVQVFYALWLGFATSIIIYSNAMNAIDPEITEAGRIDGTTSFKELIYIVVPMITPTLATYIITGTAGMFTGGGALFIFYGLNGVPENAYLMGYYLFKIAMVGDLTAYPFASAVSIMLTIITVPITLSVRWIMDKIDPMRDNYSAQ